VHFREATPDDAPAIRALMVEGFATYVEFAPAGWQPQTPPEDAFRAMLALDSHWCAIATDDDGAPLGHSAFLDSADSGHPDPEPGLAHFWQLFVRPSRWGTGLASELMARAIDAARERGFATMRLFTPSGQARARRFYEREGFALVREFDDDRLGLRVAEYRRPL
jgi:GNAT superfamily N-acetyltransferase